MKLNRLFEAKSSALSFLETPCKRTESSDKVTMMTEMMKDAAGPGRGGCISRQRKREAVLRLLRG